MLRMSVAAEEYVMIGDDIRLVFLGGTGNHMRIMIDAPRELNIVRSRALEKRIQDPELLAKMPRYYKQEEHPEKYKKKNISIVRNTEAFTLEDGRQSTKR
ncbi:MAG: carbon storage regulator [Acetatifactor sp.]